MPDSAASTKIRLRGLYKIFGANPVAALKQARAGVGKDELLEKSRHVLGLKDISLDIQESGIHVIMGLSGSGKSTLIRHINRLIDPTAGEIVINGEDVLKYNKAELLEFRRLQTAMVFQKFALLPHKTILDNVAFGLFIRQMGQEEAHKKAAFWIDRVGLSGYERHYPKQLSGGMQQRVGLARALSNDADILLMDEAFSALDPLIRKDMQDMLLQLQGELKKTIVFITHDLDEALRIGDEIAILKDGAMEQNGKPEEIIVSPANDYVRDFVKDVNRLKVLRAKTVMQKAGAPPPGGGEAPQADENACVEEFLPHLLEGGCDAVAVVNKRKEVVGYVTPRHVSDILSV